MKYLFPEGRRKAVTFSFDDGQVYDRRLIDLFNHDHLKGTFNLNSGRMDIEPYVSSSEVKQLYKGHEVASHSVSHPFLADLTSSDLITEIQNDRRALESLTGNTVTGFAYPFGLYSPQVISVLKSLGIEYARTVTDSAFMVTPEDFMQWNPSMHYRTAFNNPAIDFFLSHEADRDPMLLYIWGHSYELEDHQDWDAMETLCKKLAGHDDIWYCTNREYCRYVKAAHALIQSEDGSIIENLSNQRIWVELNGITTQV